MQGRLFLGIKVGAENKTQLKDCGLTLTTYEEKTYCGFIVSSTTSITELKTLENQLLTKLYELFPNTRFQSPVLFPELLIG